MSIWAYCFGILLFSTGWECLLLGMVVLEDFCTSGNAMNIGNGWSGIAEAIFDSYVHDIRDAHWQCIPDNPWTCSSDQVPRKCTCTAWAAGPATSHRMTIFRLALSHKCVQALLSFRSVTRPSSSIITIPSFYRLYNMLMVQHGLRRPLLAGFGQSLR